MSKTDTASDLLGDILDDSSSSYQFDPNSYFDDWFEDDTVISVSDVQGQATLDDKEQLVISSEASEDETGDEESVREAKPNLPLIQKKTNLSPRLLPLDEPSSQQVMKLSESDESSDNSGSGPGKENNATSYKTGRSMPYAPVFDDDDDGLSYDHYELVQAGGKPYAPVSRFNSQDDLDSGVVVDVQECSPFHTSSSSGKMSFDIGMSDEETSLKGKWCLVCLKTYCVIFVITVISVSGYLAADYSSNSEVNQGQVKEKGSGSGYKELRLGGRKVFYRVSDTEGMANHSVLLVHGESQNADVFLKLGTMKFLRDHGARAVAIDVIGYGRSDPPIHIDESYQDFFEEVIQLFELEYNLILVCVEQGCDKLLPYYLKYGVYSSVNSFIEGAVLVSPRGTEFSKYLKPGKVNLPTATRTVVVNGDKDAYINTDVNNNLALIPRTELHHLPDLKNNFYLNKGNSYFHAALQAFIEGLEYSYDRELQAIREQQFVQQHGNNPNNQQINQQQNQNLPNQGGGDLFSKFQQKNDEQNNMKKDFSYDPANRFSKIKGKRKK